MIIENKNGIILLQTDKLKNFDSHNTIKDFLFTKTPFTIHNYPFFSRLKQVSHNKYIRYSLLEEGDANNIDEIINKGYVDESQKQYIGAILLIMKRFKEGKDITEFLNQIKDIHEYNVSKISNAILATFSDIEKHADLRTLKIHVL